MSEKPRFERALAMAVARELLPLRECCEKFVFVGSLRRGKQDVGDIELLYVPRVVSVADPEDLFGLQVKRKATDLALESMIKAGHLAKRERAVGGTMWGEQNKFARHTRTGLPIDFFEATHANWWNLLVCRTGGAESNILVAKGAQKKGWHWAPYSAGFTRKSGLGAGPEEVRRMMSEREVFEFAGVEFKEPKDRH